MVFHLGFELPRPALLEAEQETLTPWEAEIIKRQIRKNTEVIGTYLERIDLLVNKEKYPPRENFVEQIRERMFLLMEENDTFRRVLWGHTQLEALRVKIPA